MDNSFSHDYALLISVGASAYAPWSLPVTVWDVQALEAALGTRGIAVRAGLHCAPWAHRWLETLAGGEAVRVSSSFRNSPSDCLTLVQEHPRTDRGEHMSVNDIIRDQDEMKAHTYEFILWPKRWQDFQTNPRTTYRWTICRLDKSGRNGVPDEPGIYTLLIQPGIAGHPACSYLMYVGKAQSLRDRFENYLGAERRETGRPKIFRLLNKYSDYIWFCFTSVSLAELDSVEKTLIKAYEPPCNDQIPAEVSKVRGALK